MTTTDDTLPQLPDRDDLRDPTRAALWDAIWAWSECDAGDEAGKYAAVIDQSIEQIMTEYARLAVSQAVQRERERCAQVADGHERVKWEIVAKGGKLAGFSPRDIAAAIRKG